MKKKILLISVCMLLSLLSVLVFYTNKTEEKIETTKKEMEDFPVELLGEAPKALKTEFSADDLKNKIVSDMKSLSGDKILEQQRKDKISKEVESIEDINSYSEKLKEAYQQENSDFLVSIQEIEHTFLVIKEWKSKNSFPLNPIEFLNPKMVFTLSLLFGGELKDIAEKGTQGMNLTSKDIYAIKTFSTSKDFNVLKYQDRLNATEITLEKLKTVYDNPAESEFDLRD